MLRSVVVRVVVCCGLVAGALLLELHYNLATYIQQVQYSAVQYSTVQYSTVQYSTVQYNLATYIQQVVTTGDTPAVKNIVLLKTQKV